jgi:hypothetical protein
LWRGELAQRITECVEGMLPPAELQDWALDHPFFDEREELDGEEQRIIAQALGTILEMAPDEPSAKQTTLEQLSDLIDPLWPGFARGGAVPEGKPDSADR